MIGVRVVMNNELTPGDIKKMEDEIEYRVHEVRKKALEDVKEARAQGDLSEYKISSEDDKDSHDYIRRFGR